MRSRAKVTITASVYHDHIVVIVARVIGFIGIGIFHIYASGVNEDGLRSTPWVLKQVWGVLFDINTNYPINT